MTKVTKIEQVEHEQQYLAFAPDQGSVRANSFRKLSLLSIEQTITVLRKNMKHHAMEK